MVYADYSPMARTRHNASDVAVRELDFLLIAFSLSHAGTPTVLVDENL